MVNIPVPKKKKDDVHVSSPKTREVKRNPSEPKHHSKVFYLNPETINGN